MLYYIILYYIILHYMLNCIPLIFLCRHPRKRLAFAPNRALRASCVTAQISDVAIANNIFGAISLVIVGRIVGTVVA